MRRECAPILGRPVACRTWCTCAKPVPPEHLSLRILPNRKRSGELFLNLLDVRGLTVARALTWSRNLFVSFMSVGKQILLNCPKCVCVCPPNGFLFWFLYGFWKACNIHSIPQPCLQETREPGKICGTSSGSRPMSRSSAKSKSPMTTLRSFRWCPISSGTESSQSCQSILIAKIDDRYRKYIEKMLNTYRILQKICCWTVYKLPQSLVEHIPLMFLIFHGAPGASSMIQVCIEHGHWHLI